VPLNTVTYTDRTAAAGAFLSYRVRAANAIGTSAYSNVAGVFTPPPATEARLQGRVFGTMESAAGREADKAFDGSTGSYFEARDVSGCYVGMELGDGNVAVTRVRYRPRAGQAARMTGGKIQGSTTSQTEGYADLHTIGMLANDNPVDVPVPGTPYKFVRYLGPANSNCVISEMEVHGRAP
jgi:hypothetical protein